MLAGRTGLTIENQPSDQAPRTFFGDAVQRCHADVFDAVVELPPSGLKSIAVTSLELDEQFEVDTDPYNRTGSHFVAALRDKRD